MTAELAEAPGVIAGSCRRSAVPSIDVLSKEGDLSHALGHQCAHFCRDGVSRTADFSAAGIRNNAECAELIAAFLDGDKGRVAINFTGFGQAIEFLLDVKVREETFARLPRCLGDDLRQLVIALGPDHKIDLGRAGAHFCAFRLGYASCHGNRAAAGFHVFEAPELGIDLLRRLLADMAGVEDHKVGVVCRVGGLIAKRAQETCHAFAVIDIHLTAPRFHVNALFLGICWCRHQRRLAQRDKPCHRLMTRRLMGRAWRPEAPSLLRRKRGLPRRRWSAGKGSRPCLHWPSPRPPDPR